MTSEGFDIFTDMGRKEWEEKATKDLKSLVLGSLKWAMPSCGDQPPLLFEPMYFEEDRANGPIEVLKESSGWLCGEKVVGKNKAKLIENSLEFKNAGVDAPLVNGNEDELVELFNCMPHDITLFIRNDSYSDRLLNMGESKDLVYLTDTADEMVALNTQAISLNTSIKIGFTSNSNSGADLCSNILEQAKMFNEFIVKNGTNPLPKSIYIPMTIGLDYFPSIAAIRALRIVLANILDAHGKNLDHMPFIDTYANPKAYTSDDPYINLIRGTVMAMAAVNGGSSRITLTPDNSDKLFKSNSRNILHLMKYESFMGHVSDPAAGSYYIDKMTAVMAERIWKSMNA